MLGGALAGGVTHAGMTPINVAKCNMQVKPAKYKGLILGVHTLLAEGPHRRSQGLWCCGAELLQILTTEQSSCGVGWMDVTTHWCHTDLGAICPSDQVSIVLQPPGLGAHLFQ
jgi:hypothetical protein